MKEGLVAKLYVILRDQMPTKLLKKPRTLRRTWRLPTGDIVTSITSDNIDL